VAPRNPSASGAGSGAESTAVADARAANGRASSRASGAGGKRAHTWETVKSILGTIAIFLVLRTFFFEAYRIPSGSMMPTLLIGDWLFVNKLRYGPHIPFTRWSLPGYAEPKVGDVAVFISPYQPDLPAHEDRTPTVVKRIQGAPGDTLHMRDGLLYRNGVAQPLPFRVDTLSDPNGTDPLFGWQRQYALSDSRFGPAPAIPTLDNWGPLLIPPAHFFMMGDARYASKDSRFWGIVPRENMRGRTLFVYYSYNADDSDRVLPFLTDIRWGRIGTRIR
jgi:signal peptidase I